ncbi:conserved hypothetical protein [Gammaproteobacteria bacterium]
MASLFDFSQAISKLNKEKKFAETLKYFKDSKNEFTPEQIGLNKFIVYEMISALIETNHYDVIFTFIEQHHVVLDPKNFSYLLKKFKDKPSVNWTVVNRFCDLVSADSLDTECRTIEVERKGEKKPMELASSKEDWFAVKTKALFETQHYQECFELSKIALESFEKFHYSNEVWFARRIALSKKHLGNSADALNELLLILRRKKEWFIQNEVAQIYKENGDNEQAFKFAISAINNFCDLEYKVGLILLIAELLALKQEKELSFKHYSLSKLLRIQEEWNVPNSISVALSQFSFEQIAIEKLPDLKKELKNYWSSFNQQQNAPRQNTTQRQTGKIDRILHNDEKGADGFIKFDGNKSIYFRVNTTEEIIKKITIGLEVEFKVLPATDDKKI